jgi:hypothetical protein
LTGPSKDPNKADAPKAAIAPRFRSGDDWRGVGDLRRYLIVIFLSLLASSAQAAPLTAQFTGHVTSTSDISWRRGARMLGYFTYDPQLPAGLQSADRPILVIDIPEEHFLLELKAFYIGVRDNWLDPNLSVPGDGLLITFTDPSLAFEGAVALFSTDLTLFSGNRLPATLPPLERFDAFRVVSFSYDYLGIEWAAGCRMDALSAAPGQGTIRPILSGLARDGDRLNFYFVTQPSSRYTVEFTENPASGSWVTLTNVPPMMQMQTNDAAISDSTSTGAPRFYRVRKDPM